MMPGRAPTGCPSIHRTILKLTRLICKEFQAKSTKTVHSHFSKASMSNDWLLDDCSLVCDTGQHLVLPAGTLAQLNPLLIRRFRVRIPGAPPHLTCDFTRFGSRRVTA